MCFYLICANQNGWTPLHVAAQNGNFKVLVSLLEAGADFTTRNKVSQSRAVLLGHLISVFDKFCCSIAAHNLTGREIFACES